VPARPPGPSPGPAEQSVGKHPDLLRLVNEQDCYALRRVGRPDEKLDPKIDLMLYLNDEGDLRARYEAGDFKSAFISKDVKKHSRTDADTLGWVMDDLTSAHLTMRADGSLEEHREIIGTVGLDDAELSVLARLE
jgi:hypothetical protein